NSLHAEIIDSETYWMPYSELQSNNGRGTIHFLPAFDEFTVSYTDRTASISPEAAKLAITGYAIFNPTIVVKGQIVGIWKRSFAKAGVVIEKQLFPDAGDLPEKGVSAAASRYSAFTGLKPSVHQSSQSV